MEPASRTRLAETCGTREESPSSNLDRGKQGKAIRADCMKPEVAAEARDEEMTRRPPPAKRHGERVRKCPGQSSAEEGSKTHRS